MCFLKDKIRTILNYDSINKLIFFKASYKLPFAAYKHKTMLKSITNVFSSVYTLKIHQKYMVEYFVPFILDKC